jgi:Helicase conserved C-terminal domain
VARLLERALVWGAPEALQLAAGVREQLGAYPLGLGASLAELLDYVGIEDLDPVLEVLALAPDPKAGPRQVIVAELADPARRDKLVSEVSDDARDILNRLSLGPPTGLLPAAFSWPPGEKVDPVTELVVRGLLVLAGGHTAELPRELGRQLRGEQALGWARPQPPEALAARRDARDIDATGSVAALELVRLIDALGTSWSDDPPAQLRSGGLGVRDLRRTAKTLAVEETMVSLLIELAVAADLISAPMAREQPWRPTTDYDTWTQRRPEQQWLRLAQAWRTMTRAPHLVGQRDERGKARSALSYEVERSTAPGVRGEVMAILAAAPAGAVGPPTEVLDRLAWLLPRREPLLREPAAAALAEAEILGITGGGGLTSFGRAVLADDPRQAERLLATVLPEPVDYFLLQPDLTLVVPGPPTADLAREIALLADLESAGGASVFRISESSVRRAFDAGQSAADIRAVLAARSRTPLPQALGYLVDDLARRHGVLRAGAAGCYLRCDDVSLLDRVVGDRGIAAVRWHRLAPTVAVTATEPERVLELLRAAGYAPAAEDVTGLSITVGAAPARSRPRRPESNRTMLPPELPDTVLEDAVRRMRRTDELARTAHRVNVGPDVPGVTSATTLNVLRQAIRSDGQVWVSVADGTGSTTSHILAPLSLAAGYLRGHDVETGDFRTVPLHRITSVNVLS